MARTDFQKAVDDKLTGYLNNDEVKNNDSSLKGLRKFLLLQLQKLNKELTETFGENVRFFVKGSNALRVLKNQEGQGAENPFDLSLIGDLSDWDTQIIINPNLSTLNWYQHFIALHHFLDHFLESFQIKFNKKYKDKLAIQLPEEGPNEWLVPIKDGEKKTKVLPSHRKNQTNSYSSFNPKVFHPTQTIDNFTCISEKARSSDGRLIQYINEQIINHDDEAKDYLKEVSTYFPYNDVNSKKEAESGKNSSSIINVSIDGFYLYRQVVRYESLRHKKDGTRVTDLIKDGSNASFRGELIDISIPRRDTLEALHQWRNVEIINRQIKCSALTRAVEIPIPKWHYHLEENMIMIMENLEGISRSTHKLPKRIKRSLIALKELDFNPEEFSYLKEKIWLKKLYAKSLEYEEEGYHWKSLLYLRVLHNLEQDFQLSQIIRSEDELKGITNMMFDKFEDLNQISDELNEAINSSTEDEDKKKELIFILKYMKLEKNLIDWVRKPEDYINWSLIKSITSFLEKKFQYTLGPFLSISVIKFWLTPYIDADKLTNKDFYTNETSSTLEIFADKGVYKAVTEDMFKKVEELKWNHFIEQMINNRLATRFFFRDMEYPVYYISGVSIQKLKQLGFSFEQAWKIYQICTKTSSSFNFELTKSYLIKKYKDDYFITEYIDSEQEQITMHSKKRIHTSHKPLSIKFSHFRSNSKHFPLRRIRGYRVLHQSNIMFFINKSIAEAKSFIRMHSLNELRKSYYKSLVTFSDLPSISEPPDMETAMAIEENSHIQI